ncbi:MAG TPA: hypothetical protein VFY36_07805 [Solirubrobacteraceae bacterium]|nr:hypothetical protein [Solirubrobacteraceae bacterium]
MSQRLFIFVQMEFPWILGPPDGRYLLRGGDDGEPERVVVLDTLAATRLAGARERKGARGSLLRRSIGAEVEPQPDPESVSTTRATVIDPVSLSAENQARAWLGELDGEREALATVAVINRVLHSHRIASADPYVHEVSPAQALTIKAGWGEGEQVADGRWLHAHTLTWKREGRGAAGYLRGGRARSRALRPQERLAELLGARGRALVCEELTLRARLDLDHGRARHAALELDRALALAAIELPAETRPDLAIRIAELEQLHTGVAEQTSAALTQDGPEVDAEILTHALERLEAALRARSAAGFTLQ